MRRALLAAVLFALSCAAWAAPRALWIWEGDTYAMLEHEGAALDAIDFLKAKRITTAYLYADAWQGRNLIADEPQRYRRLVRRLHAQGVKVQALLGSGPLHTERYVLPAYRQQALVMVQRILDYNGAAAPEERFDGVSLDIEPHILAEWSTRRAELLAGFLDMSAALVRLKNAASPGLPMGPAIPFWLDGIELDWNGQRRPVNQHVQDLYDYVALMDYRDHADGGDGLVSHASDELAYGERIGRPVVIGVETAPNAIRKTSFNHLREADLERELAATERAVGASRAFGGFAIHHYGSYKRWAAQD